MIELMRIKFLKTFKVWIRTQYRLKILFYWNIIILNWVPNCSKNLLHFMSVLICHKIWYIDVIVTYIWSFFHISRVQLHFIFKSGDIISGHIQTISKSNNRKILPFACNIAAILGCLPETFNQFKGNKSILAKFCRFIGKISNVNQYLSSIGIAFKMWPMKHQCCSNIGVIG